MLEIKQHLLEFLKTGVLLGTFGGVVSYFVRLNEDDTPFSVKEFFLYILTATFIGYIVGHSLSPDFFFRDGWVGGSGVLAYPIILLLRKSGIKLFLNKFGLHIGN